MKKKGFTLIELMIVMAIIAILVGMVLPRFKGLQDQAKISKAQGEVRALKTALESYFIRWNGWPPDPEAGDSSTAWQAALVGTSPQLISAALMDPFIGVGTTQQYSAALSANSQYYVIWAFGPDATTGVTGISNEGVVAGTPGDDVWTSNAQ